MGFFYKEAERVIKWSASTLDSLDILASNDIIDEIGGIYDYYAYILSDFNPIEAEKIKNDCSIEQITKAMMARYNYNKPIDDA